MILTLGMDGSGTVTARLGLKKAGPDWIFATSRNGGACDSYGTKIELFKDVRTIITELKELGIPLAAASR